LQGEKPRSVYSPGSWLVRSISNRSVIQLGALDGSEY
jgi:hypothetical protein